MYKSIHSPQSLINTHLKLHLQTAPKIWESGLVTRTKTLYVLCQQSLFGAEESTTFLTPEGSRLIPRPFKNGNKASS